MLLSNLPSLSLARHSLIAGAIGTSVLMAALPLHAQPQGDGAPGLSAQAHPTFTFAPSPDAIGAPIPPAQAHPARNAAAAAHALDNTLEKLRAEVRQQHPPKARYNPGQGAPPNSNGNPAADNMVRLSAPERDAIGNHVRPCWTNHSGSLDLSKMQVLLNVVTDADGVVREATVAPQDQAKLANPRFRVFTERAIRAVRSPSCANLPLPNFMLGKVNRLTFLFTP